MAVTSLATKTKSTSILAGNSGYLQQAFDSIQTVTVGSGGAAYIDFTSIPSTYKHLQIRGIARNTSVSNNTESYYLRFNGDSTSGLYNLQNIWSGSYSGTPSANTANSQNAIAFWDMPRSSTSAGAMGGLIVDIFDYASTSKFKTVKYLSGTDTNQTGNSWHMDGGGAWGNTSAITSIRLLPVADNFTQYSSFALYGIKGV